MSGPGSATSDEPGAAPAPEAPCSHPSMTEPQAFAGLQGDPGSESCVAPHRSQAGAPSAGRVVAVRTGAQAHSAMPMKTICSGILNHSGVAASPLNGICSTAA